ncbi:MAG: hypothetical protein ABIR37_00165 [Candidatus Saccharimonadales bacterium]
MVRQEILETAREYRMFQNPDIFDVVATGVPLNGSMPRSIKGILGQGHKHLSFKAAHDTSSMPADADVFITLHGSQPGHQIHIDSDPAVAVEFGWNKPFLVSPHEWSQTAKMDCGDVATMLDEYIPDATRSFEKLVDPRAARSFGAIALGMGDAVKEIAKTSKTSRSFIEKEYADDYTATRGAMLKIEETNGVPKYTLSVTAPLDTWSKRVIERFSYSFEFRQPQSHLRDLQPVDSTVSVQLLSQDVSRKDLEKSLTYIQSNIDGYHVCLGALQSLARKFR